MKKAVFLLALVLLLSLFFADEVFAAPSVAIKTGAMAGTFGVEAGISGSGTRYLLICGVNANGFSVAIGTHGYLPFEHLRPFLGCYFGLGFFDDPYYSSFAAVVCCFTAGLEYLGDSGFLATAELGIGWSGDAFAPALGLSIGYQF